MRLAPHTSPHMNHACTVVMVMLRVYVHEEVALVHFRVRRGLAVKRGAWVWQGGGVAAGGKVSLQSTADYVLLGKDLGTAMKKGSSRDVAAFMNELLMKGAKEPLEVDDINEIIKSESPVLAPPGWLC